MDTASVLTLFLLALALAVQPWSVLAAVLLVVSRRGFVKASAFVAGWMLALTAVAIICLVLNPASQSSSSPSPALSAIELAAGLVLLGWVLVRRRRPVSATATKQPAWMGRLDSMSPWAAFILGGFLPNYVIVVAAVSNVLQAQLSTASAIASLVLFVLVASAGVAAPLLVRVFKPREAAAIYQQWHGWLVGHSQALVLGVLGLVGFLLAVKGTVGLTS